MTDRGYYMVRAMESSAEDFKAFFDNGVVGVGWSDVDFTAFPEAEALCEEIARVYYADEGMNRGLRTRYLNNAMRFKNIKKGDYVIVPYYSNIVIAEVEGTELYSPVDYHLDLANQKKVFYLQADGDLLTIPRKNLSTAFQNRLKSLGSSVLDLKDFAIEIDSIVANGSYSYSNEMLKQENQEIINFKQKLLRYIQEGKNNLQAGGVGMENLIREILQCEGYEAKVLAKNKFKGHADADIYATKEDSFVINKIMLQVKHHSGVSGQEGVQQIIEVLALPEYSDCLGYFVTSGEVQQEVKQFAKDHGIRVIDGKGVVELIYKNMDKLSVTTKRALGISMVPHLVEL